MNFARMCLDCLLCMGLLVGANAGETITPPHVDTAPQVDGSLEDAAWAEAAATGAFHALGPTRGEPVDTRARVCVADDMLYIAFRCMDPDGEVVAEHTGHTAPSRDDTVEVFLGPRQGGANYAHFRLGAGGAFFEQMVAGGDKDRLWRTPWLHAVATGDEGWTAEVGIPLYVLGSGTIGEAPLAFNLTRSHAAGGGNMEHYTWTVLKGMFHDPDNFGGLLGLAGHGVEPACVPMIARATALNYEVSAEGFGYLVRVNLVNSGGKAGTSTLRLIDEVEGGTPEERTRTVKVTAEEHQTVRWQVPVDRLGARTARIRVHDGAQAAWIEVEDAQSLQCIKAYPGRSYYTTEQEAQILCVGVFDEAQAEAAGFELAVQVTEPRGEAVHEGVFTEVGRRSLHAVPIEDLAPDAYTATVTLRDAEGKTVAQAACELAKRPPGPATAVKFDHIKSQLLVDDEPFFPVGYMARSTPWTPQELAMFRDGGVNCLVYWSGVLGGTAQSEEAQHELVRECALVNRHGIKLFLPLLSFGPNIRYGVDDMATGIEELNEALPAALRRFRDVEGVIGYYGLDEPPPRFYQYATESYRILKSVDPYRLLYSSNCGDWEPVGYTFFDLLGRHGYWMPFLRFSPNKLGRRTTVMRTLAEQYHRPFVATPQGFWREESRVITPHEMRASYYVPLIHGAKGLIVFCYSKERFHPAEYKAATEVFHEVRQLAPVLLEPDPPQNVVCRLDGEPGGLPPEPKPALLEFVPPLDNWQEVELDPVQVLVKNHPEGGEVILVSNTANQPREVVYTLSSLTAESRVVNFFEPAKSYERAGAQGFADRLEGWGVRVYRTLDTNRPPDEGVRMAVNIADAAGPLETTAANLLAGATPGFEAADLAENWEVRADTNARIVTDNPAEGERALAVDSNPEGWASVRLDGVALEPQSRYRVSFQYRNAFTAGQEAAQALVLVPGEHDTPPRFVVDTPLVQEDWDGFSQEFTTEQAVEVSFLFRRRGGQGTFWIDDLRLERLADLTEAPKNLLKNASFEQCTYFGKTDWWIVRDTTADQERHLRAWEHVVDTDAVHGDKAIRGGFWRPTGPASERFRNLMQWPKGAEGLLDLAQNYVFSIYLKADREDVPVSLFISDVDEWVGREGVAVAKQVTVGTEWARYVVKAPFKDQGLTGGRPLHVAVRVEGQGNILADAAQLEVGTEPTPFEVDDYRAPDIGPAYSREAVLGEE